MKDKPIIHEPLIEKAAKEAIDKILAMPGMKSMIAFRDIDNEWDVWNERVFLFDDEEAVKKFFVADNPYLKNIYTDQDSDEDEDDTLYDFEVQPSPADIINGVNFHTEYAGDVVIRRMGEGFVISYKP